MGQSQTLELLIKAKGDFESTFSQLIANMKKVDDQAKAQKSSFEDLRKGMDGFFTGNAASFKAIGEGLALVGGAVVAAGAAIIALGTRGSDVADVEEHFDFLNNAIGNTTDVIGPLRAALANTVSDFDIMKTVNVGLSAGLKLTAADMELVGKGARVLGDTVNKDTKQAFDELFTAMTTGRDRALPLLGLTVDLAGAQQRLADSLRKSVADLTDVQKLEANRNAILDGLRLKLLQSGEAQIDFSDRVKIGRVAIDNFTDSLGKAISQSPVINKAMDVIGAAVLEAFGKNKTATIETLIGWINQFAIWMVKTGSVAVDVARFIANAWQGLKVMFNAVMEGLVGALALFTKGLTLALSAYIAITPGGKKLFGGLKEQLEEDAASLEQLSKGFKAQKEAAIDSAQSQNAAFDQTKKFLGNLTTEMEKAAGSTVKLGAAHRGAAKDTETHGAAVVKVTKAVEDWRKKVFELDAVLKLAEKNFTPLDVVIKQYGSSIEEAARQGLIFGETLPASIARMAAAMKAAKIDEIMRAQMQGVAKEVEKAASALRTTIDKLHDENAKKLGQILKDEADQQKAAEEAAERHRDAIIGLSNAIGDLGSEVGGTFGKMLSGGAELLSMYMNATKAASALEKAQVAVQAVQSAYKGGSVMGGAAKGAAVGTAIMPGWGTAIGAVVGGIAGFLGGQAQKKKDLVEAQRMEAEFIKMMGGMEAMNKIASQLGINMTTAFDAKNPKAMQAEIDRVKEAMAAHQARIEASVAAMSGLELRTKGFAEQMEKGGGASERTQAAFDRLGTYALVTFGAYIRETGDAIGALQQMGASLDQLSELQVKFGFSSNAAVTQLLGLRDVVTANADLADSLSGLNQLMTSLGKAGYENAALFQAFGSDAADLFQSFIERGVPANQAMALMQPTLQSLWEHQQKFHDTTDAATLALLKQAEEQGIVGENMKDVNERILDVLLAMADVMGATIPAAMRTMAQQAEVSFGGLANAADTAANAVGGIPGGPDPGSHGHGGHGGDDAPGYAAGGTIPWTPGGRLVRVGESGTEHIVTSAQLAEIIGRAGAMNGGSNQGGGQVINLTVPVYIGAQQLDEVINKRIAAGYIGRPQ